ncbi:MAG: DNA mismatch repair endonuclease MutL [Lachnospiraceae bacterium]|nr:DNA mismatch repair endonuclease MutL [Lachnospiraceae bacterium]
MINILDTETINRIAAGEVIERPASVVKELVENAIDASASTITVEIKGGGTDLIRITDNGCGINKSEVKTAFLPHATSKLKNASDLFTIGTLGFRGEALPSIASISDTSIITKERSALLGVHYEPGTSENVTEVGAPDGTTVIVKDIFLKIPARRKFLKSAATEAAYCSDVIEKTALVNPGISFRLISNGRSVFFSNGNGNVKDIIYSMYGKEMSDSLVPIDYSEGSLRVCGFIAKPIVARANRSDEYYYVNGRYIRNKTVTKAIEDAYAPFLMQHKYPFTVMFINIDKDLVDINVHPAKLEVRFKDSVDIYDVVYHAVKNTLEGLATIPKAIDEATYKPFKSAYDDLYDQINANNDPAYTLKQTEPEVKQKTRFTPEEKGFFVENSFISEVKRESVENPIISDVKNDGVENSIISDERKYDTPYKNAPQFSLDTQTGDIHEETKEDFKATLNADYNIIGQVFDTYWLITRGDEAFFIDQHAAHEKILYEKFMGMAVEELCTPQVLMPGICVSLNGKEIECLETNMKLFNKLGFEIENYGGREYLLTSVPMQDHGIDPKALFLEFLNDMLDKTFEKEKTLSLREQLATRACKAAIKGNSKISYTEAKKLIEMLLNAKDPFNCPHGRPVFISITKEEMEKMFKRIV